MENMTEGMETRQLEIIAENLATNNIDELENIENEELIENLENDQDLKTLVKVEKKLAIVF